MPYEIRHLRAFVAVAETLNFNRAATTLGLTSPAVSRTIADLEDRLGVSLLERSTRSVALTVPGRWFLDEAQNILRRVETSMSLARGLAEGTHGTLSVAYTALAAQRLVPAVVARFRQAHPQISIVLSSQSSDAQRRSFAESEIDIGFATGPFAAPEVASRMVARDRLNVILPEDHRLAGRPSLTPADIAEEPLIIGSRDTWSTFRRIVDDVFETAGVTPPIAQEVPSVAALLGLVAAGFGVTLFAGTPHRYNGAALAAVPLDTNRHRDVETCMVWRRDRMVDTTLQFVRTADRVARELDGNGFGHLG